MTEAPVGRGHQSGPVGSASWRGVPRSGVDFGGFKELGQREDGGDRLLRELHGRQGAGKCGVGLGHVSL